MERNSKAGRQKVDTKVPIPRPWETVTCPVRPAMYPLAITTKHCKIAGQRLSNDTLSLVPVLFEGDMADVLRSMGEDE